MKCYDCCRETAAAYGCDCGEYCVESSEWENHICESCETPLCQAEICYFCEKCIDCCSSESECTEHWCVEDDRYEEHFCEDCGDCFHNHEMCESCYDAGELRCTMCCETAVSIEGCYCNEYCINDDNLRKHLKEFHNIEPEGFTVNGTATSFGEENDNVVVVLINKENSSVVAEYTMIGNSAQYTFEDIENGNYIIRVTKLNHVMREYEITVEDGDVVQNLKIHLLGDVNGDGKINVQDYSKTLRHVKKTETLEGYEFDCADVTGDSKINVQDYSKILRHVKKTASLW